MTQAIELPAFPVTGGCQCGAVRYRLTGAPLTVYRCHCKDCQRLSGAAWSMSMPVGRERLELVAGRPESYDKPADSGRVVRMHGCGVCGTKLWNEPLAAPNMLILKPGTLDDAGWAIPIGNIWTDSALPWQPIEEREVNFPGQPPDRQPLYDAWTRATAS